MRYKIDLLVTVALFVSLSFWSCSGGPRPKPEPKAPAAAPVKQAPKIQEQTPPAQTQPQPQKTEIPAREEESDPLVQEHIEPENSQNNVTDVQDKDELGAMMENALSACQEADQLWQKGELDAAIDALDQAYSLMLKMELPSDSPLIQEKNNLRLMIAKRIQTLHASRLAAPKENHKTIPLVENKYVLQEIESFRTKERKTFEEGYERSGLYREMIAEEMRKAGLPEELGWLPMVESWFKVRALSRARALGLWQFISSTASLYDLKRDRYVDERMDPVKSTRAAARYFAELHNLFGDWTTALASYNCGEFKVQRVINAQQINYLDNFWDLFAMLPYETARFVPRFIAVLTIIKDPAKYGFTLPQPYPPLRFEAVTVNHPVKLSSLSAALGLDPSELAFLNPELRYDATPDYSYELRVPVGFAERTLAAVSSLPRWIPPEATYTIHYVRRGETLGGIAQRYRSSVSAIARLNGLRSTRLIRPGQRLKIPGRGYIPANPPVVRSTEAPASLASMSPPDGDTYTVQGGDTLYSISRKFGLSLEEFLSLNGLTINSTIYPGQALKVRKK